MTRLALPDDSFGFDWLPGRDSPFDLAALACTAILTGSYLAVLYHVVDVVGGHETLLLFVAGALALAAVFRTLSQVQAVALATVLLVVGLALYLTTIPPAYLADLSPERALQDTVALLTGFSVLRMAKAGNWALAVAPGPTFLTWYFALRRERTAAAFVGGLTLGFFVLTGDSGTVGTLLGVLGAAGLVGFGTLAEHDAGREQVEVIAGVFALMIVASATVTAVPGGASPLVPPGTTSVDGDITSSSEQVTLGGSIELSPKVQFVVRAERPAYWRVSVYDRYTGDGWVRTGVSDGGDPVPPPGPSQSLRQVVTAKRTLNAMPAASQPVDVWGEDASFTRFGDLRLDDTLQKNDTYTVVSQVPAATTSAIWNSGTDYPEDVEDRYLQVPSGMSPRVANLAANVTEGQETPYGNALAVRDWLEANKAYSLDVRHPRGDVVETFLFETDRGYCVYYASAMTMMLRTQGIPARFVVGYSSGQRVSEEKWVVRGYDSHAWVEVYFPDVGWVKFDPTPGGPRQAAENDLLADARQEDAEGVDTAESQNGTWTPTTTTQASVNGTVTSDPADDVDSQFAQSDPTVGESGNDTVTTSSAGASPQLPRLPPPGTLALWGVLAVGLVAGVRRTGLSDLAYRELWLRWLPNGPPDQATEAAFERVEYVLERRHRPRQPNETIREYLDAVDADDRARRVAALRERAKYADGVAEPAATEASELARGLAADQGVIARIRRGDSV